MKSKNKVEHVKSFFDDTERYLADEFIVDVRAKIVCELLGKVTQCRIIDIGCGNGKNSLQFLSDDNEITLVDISANMLERAHGNVPHHLLNHVKFVNMDFHQYYPDYKYDVVICLGVLGHVESIDESIDTISRLLTNNGYAIMQITDANTFTGRINYVHDNIRFRIGHTDRHKLNKTTLAEINYKALKHGLRLQDYRQYLMLFPGMGRFPNTWLKKYTLMTLSNRWLSRWGSDYILLYHKT